jgi:FlaA1/EpsC-like NDP-sugar epimerase
MTRFVMTLPDAVRLVMDSVFLARGGEVFVTKMPVARIIDLAQVMIDELAPRYGRDRNSIKVQVIGSKPGEKLYEELMNEEETRRTVELDRYFSLIPAFKTEYRSIHYDYPGILREKVDRAYNSAVEQPMTPDQLRAYLRNGGVLDEPA